MVIRFIDTSRKQGVEHAAALLKDSWRLSWTKMLTLETDSAAYVRSLEHLLKTLQGDCSVFLLRPDKEFNCLRRFEFQPTNPFAAAEIQHVRQFLLAVTRRIFAKLGQSNPFVLCIDDLESRLQIATRNAAKPADSYIQEFPPLVRRFALDRGFSTKHLLEGPIKELGRTFNKWRMENGLDPLYHLSLEPTILKWRSAILQITKKAEAKNSHQHSRPQPRASVVSIDVGDVIEETPPDRNDSYAKLDLVVPTACLRYAKGRGIGILVVTQLDNFDSLVEDIYLWRREQQLSTIGRPQLLESVKQWRQNLDLVFLSLNSSEDSFLGSLDTNMQRFLRHENITSSDQYISVDAEALKKKYRAWRNAKGLHANVHTDMEITDGRSKVSRLQAAACAFRTSRAEKEQKISGHYPGNKKTPG